MKILGIDYGRNKIGMVVGETETKLVEPLETVRSRSPVLSIKKIATREKVEKVVVGVPGGKMEEEIRRFGYNLWKETGLPVEFFDETLTTQDAQKALIAGGGRRKARREREDTIAAAIMLELYLDRLRHVPSGA